MNLVDDGPDVRAEQIWHSSSVRKYWCWKWICFRVYHRHLVLRYLHHDEARIQIPSDREDSHCDVHCVEHVKLSILE